MSKLFSIAALAVGIAALVLGLPGWLLKAEVVAVAVFALGYGFFSPPAWSRHPEVRGMALIYASVGVMLSDPRFIISGFLLGVGIRQVMGASFVRVGPVVGTSVVVREKANGVTR